MNNTEAREFVRGELVWTTDFLRKNYGFNLNQARRLLREMIPVSI